MKEFTEVAMNGRTYRVEFTDGVATAVKHLSYVVPVKRDGRYQMIRKSEAQFVLVWRQGNGKEPGKILKNVIAAGHAERAAGRQSVLPTK